MNTKDIIFTIFEILMVISIFLCMKYEYKLIDFETVLKIKIKKFLRGIK